MQLCIAQQHKVNPLADAAVAHVLEESTGKWWRFDDETVTPMPDGPVGEKADHGVSNASSTGKVCKQLYGNSVILPGSCIPVIFLSVLRDTSITVQAVVCLSEDIVNQVPNLRHLDTWNHIQSGGIMSFFTLHLQIRYS